MPISERGDEPGQGLAEILARLPAPDDAVAFAKEIRDPDRHPFTTPSGKIEIYSEKIASFGYDDCPGHPTWLEPTEWLGAPIAQRFPLQLIANNPTARLHSQLDYVPPEEHEAAYYAHLQGQPTTPQP